MNKILLDTIILKGENEQVEFKTSFSKEVIESLVAFIKKHLMVEYIITSELQHIERFDYPLEAIREIVINMIVHRDYRNSSASIIKIFDDRIEFFNPGKLFGGITIENLLSDNYTSQARNKLLAKAFKEIGIIERYGSGIRRIRNICREYAIIEPLFEEVFNGFRVILFKEKNRNVGIVGESILGYDTDNDTDNDTETRLKKLLILIAGNKRISIKKLAELCLVSTITVKRDIEKLKKQGKLQRIGDSKTGYWKVEGGAEAS